MGQRGAKKKKRKGKDGVLVPRPQARKEEEGKIVKKWYLFLAVVGLITLISYLNCVHNQLVFDDIYLLADNPAMGGIEKIPRLLGIGTSRVFYRPIRMVSYAVDYTLNNKLWRHFESYTGNDPGFIPLGYHLSNLIYHILTTFLVFLVVYRLTAHYRIAFVAASLFALHPVHTDSVTYISGRRDILFTLFYLAGFYFFLRYRQTGKIMYTIGAFLSYLLSLGSKEMGVTLPAIFLFYDLVEHFQKKVRTINLTYLKELFLTLGRVIAQSRYLYSLFFLVALVFSYYKVSIKSPSLRSVYYGGSIPANFYTVAKILVHYIKLLIYPVTLNADYSYDVFPLSSSLFEPATLFSLIFLALVGYGIVRLMVTLRMVAFGLIWFFVSLLPVCQIFPHHELLAEHYLYLPSVGFCLVGAVLLESVLKEKRYSTLVYASVVLVIISFSLRIAVRNRDWKDELSLWEKTVRTAPRCARAHYNLGLSYDKEGRLDEAISEYTQSIVITPRRVMPLYNLGLAYSKKGKLDEAITEFEKALAINPKHAKSHYSIGAVYGRRGMLDEAMAKFKEALAINPKLAKAHYNLGLAYYKKGMLDEAISEYKKTLAIDPNHARAHSNLGLIYFEKGLVDTAISEYKKALAITPNLPEARYNLRLAYDKKRQVR